MFMLYNAGKYGAFNFSLAAMDLVLLYLWASLPPIEKKPSTLLLVQYVYTISVF